MEMRNGNYCECVALVNMLKDCGKNKDLCKGSRLHDDILRKGLFGKNSYVSSSLVSMYVKCGSLTKAQELIDELLVRDVISWSALIAGYAQEGKGLDALNCFEQMKREGIFPDAITFTCMLKACGSIEAFVKAKQVHNEIISRGVLGRDIQLGTGLVDMYAKCGMLAEAQKVLKELPVRNVISWNALIAGYSQHGQCDEALNCFEQMQTEGICPNAVTFTCILKACGSSVSLNKGKKIHEEIARTGLLEKDIVLGNALIDMYARCGEVEIAHHILEELPVLNVVSWTSLIRGFVEHEQSHKALDFFDQMRREGFIPNAVTFICILKACGSTRDIKRGIEIHEEIESRGLLEKDSALGIALVNLYAKCGKLAKAQEMLEELSIRNVDTWNSLIAGYVQQGQCHEVLNCFEKMQRIGVSPNAATFVYILNVYAKLGAIHKGKEIHDEILNLDLLECNVVLGTALVNMYAKCGALHKAAQVLEGLRVRDVISWYTLIAAYAWHGQRYEALECFKLMEKEGLAPDHIIFTCILKTCGNIGTLYRGKPIHGGLTMMGFPDNDVMVDTSLVDMHAKLTDMKSQFHEVDSQTLISLPSQPVEYGKCAYCLEALNCLHDLQQEELSANPVNYILMLRVCGRTGAVDKGEQIHHEIVNKCLLEKDIVLGTALIDMYAKCGLFSKAQEILEGLPIRDVVSWSALIAGYVQQGQCVEALNCFEQMRYEGHCPDAIIFTCILKACGRTGSLSKGKQIHEEIMHKDLVRKDTMIGTALIDMYAKCGLLEKAEEVMKQLPARNEVTWSALITGYTKQGRFDEALKCFGRMQAEGFSPNKITFISVLNACGSLCAVEDGEMIYNRVVYSGLEKDVVLGTALVVFYSKCGVVAKAEYVLEQLPFRDVVSWNALIVGYAQQGQFHEALNSLEQMQNEGLSPNVVTFTCILKACGNAGATNKGKQIHDEILNRRYLEMDVVIGNALVGMYGRCGLLTEAQEVLNKLPVRNVISWSALIAAYAKQGQGGKALDCFEHMQNAGHSPNVVTFICILKACGSIGALQKGKQIHDEIMRRGLLENSVFLGNAIVDMYAKCGNLRKAQEVFEKLPVHDVVTWSTIIAGYAQHGRFHEAINCFDQMRSEGVQPNDVTLTCILKVCGCIGALDKGEQIHKEIVNMSMSKKNQIPWASLVDMFIRCGAVAKSQELLEDLPSIDSAFFNALIVVYDQHQKCHEILNCFKWMRNKGLSPDVVSLTCILKACGSTGMLDHGTEIHQEILTRGLLEKDAVLGNTLVDMYVKCGFLGKAQQVLEELPVRNVVSWSTLIAGYAERGRGSEALNCFEQMRNEGLAPDDITFVCLLNACARSGLSDEARIIFGNMKEEYSITPNLEHHICMMMAFGCTGYIEEMISMIKDMPSSDDLVVWLALLGACRKWVNVNLGIFAFDQALQRDNSCAAAYILMADIFAAADLLEDAERLENRRLEYISQTKQQQSSTQVYANWSV